MITFLKEIIDDDFKRIVFEPTCMDVAVYIIDIYVRVCVYYAHYTCVL